MNAFMQELSQIAEKFTDVQRAEITHSMKVKEVQEELQSLLRKYGLPENHTITDIMLFAAKNAKDGIEVVR